MIHGVRSISSQYIKPKIMHFKIHSKTPRRPHPPSRPKIPEVRLGPKMVEQLFCHVVEVEEEEDKGYVASNGTSCYLGEKEKPALLAKTSWKTFVLEEKYRNLYKNLLRNGDFGCFWIFMVLFPA